MPFDGILVHNMAQELDSLLSGGRIGKIYQTDKETIIIHIRARGENYKLLLSSNASSARIHLTENQYDNPETPPVFCMLLRKHLTGGTIKGFYTNGFERIINMETEVTDELGDKSIKMLIIEIMGRHSNIILLNNNDKIIDSIKHVDFEVNRVREILPARTYILPPAQNKLDPSDPGTPDLLLREAPYSSRKTESFLLDRLQGFSPILCREICYRAGIDEAKPACELSFSELQSLMHELKELMQGLKTNGPSPSIVFDDSTKKPIDFHCINLRHYQTSKNFEMISSAVDIFFMLKNSRELNSQRARELHKLVEKQLEKCEKRLEINLKTYEESKNYEDYRLFGELITANIYALSKGMEKATVVNYYSETGDTIEIPLDKNKSPQENARQYFKMYNKSKTALLYSQKEIESLKSEIAYLESILFAIENAESPEQLNEIRMELYEQGYANPPRSKGKKDNASPIMPLKVISQDGFEIMIGRNNKQNDKLTLKIARNDDIWLHIKNFPGSHVVIRTEGKQVPDTTLIEAAQYAAWFSKARSSPKAEVDYTQVRNVKKPSGSKPGMVTYVNYNTVLVTPKAPET